MVLFIDCQVAGISGDMILSSLVDLGANKSKIIEGVKKSADLLGGTTIRKLDFIKVQKNGKSATQLILEIDENTHERKGSDMKKCIESASDMLKLSTIAKEFAVKSINTLNATARAIAYRSRVLCPVSGPTSHVMKKTSPASSRRQKLSSHTPSSCLY